MAPPMSKTEKVDERFTMALPILIVVVVKK